MRGRLSDIIIRFRPWLRSCRKAKTFLLKRHSTNRVAGGREKAESCERTQSTRIAFGFVRLISGFGSVSTPRIPYRLYIKLDKKPVATSDQEVSKSFGDLPFYWNLTDSQLLVYVYPHSPAVSPTIQSASWQQYYHSHCNVANKFSWTGTASNGASQHNKNTRTTIVQTNAMEGDRSLEGHESLTSLNKSSS